MATKETKAAEPGTAVVTWRDKMAAVTKQAASSEAPKGGFLSFKGGNMSYDDVPIPGNVLKVVVVDFLLENAIFKEKYNPNKPASPMCYAFGRDEEDLAPHPDAPEPQNADCATCPNNAWASDPDGGRGKACKNSRRIAIMTADVLDKGPEAIRKANIVMCKIPVTSIKNFSLFVNQCVQALGTPPFGVICELSVKPHPTSLFQVHWKVLEKIEDEDVLQHILAKHLSGEQKMFQPYPVQEEEAAPAPRSKKF